jgi:DNA-binding MarR family transcriptional regulator
MATTPDERSTGVAARAAHMMGACHAHELAGDPAMAWEGMLELSRSLRRAAEDLLTRESDLSVSMLGLLGRLAVADDRTLRQTALAQAMGLSLSRVSRIIDLLEERALVSRTPCPSDARATNVTLTQAGAERTTAAQEQLYGLVREAFFDRVSEDELRVLAQVFQRLVDDTP